MSLTASSIEDAAQIDAPSIVAEQTARLQPVSARARKRSRGARRRRYSRFQAGGFYPVMAATMISAMPMITDAMTMASATF